MQSFDPRSVPPFPAGAELPRSTAQGEYQASSPFSHLSADRQNTSAFFSDFPSETHTTKATFHGSNLIPDEQIRNLPVALLLRQTGFSIKVRFLLALILIAFVPAIVLVTLLGDPTGQEQHSSVVQALSWQAQAQATVINNAFTHRVQALHNLAAQSVLAQSETGDSIAVSTAQSMLQSAAQVDSATVAWMIVRQDGSVLASSPTGLTGTMLVQSNIVTQPQQLLALLHNSSSSAPPFIVSDDSHIAGGWMATAAPLKASTQGSFLLGIFSLQRMLQGTISTPATTPGAVALLLDQHQRILATTGKQALFQTIPASVVTTTATPFTDPVTGSQDIAASAVVPALRGHYLLLVPQQLQLVPSARTFFAGRNTPLLLLTILVLVVLVGTWVALPIVRPIRRATREIRTTTEDVRILAESARQIAKDHTLGTTILDGASKRLATRRQSIIRDGTTILQTCQALLPRIAWIIQLAQQGAHPNRALLDALNVIQQGTQQISTLASSITHGLEADSTLSQLSGAMESAREISTQFEEAGQQLEQGAATLERAAATLL